MDRPTATTDDVWTKVPNLKRLHDEIGARPAALRAVALKDTVKFKTEMDADAKRHMFRHMAPA